MATIKCVEPSDNDDLEHIAGLFRKKKARVIVITGAGISTSAGIPVSQNVSTISSSIFPSH